MRERHYLKTSPKHPKKELRIQRLMRKKFLKIKNWYSATSNSSKVHKWAEPKRKSFQGRIWLINRNYTNFEILLMANSNIWESLKKRRAHDKNCRVEYYEEIFKTNRMNTWSLASIKKKMKLCTIRWFLVRGYGMISIFLEKYENVS